MKRHSLYLTALLLLLGAGVSQAQPIPEDIKNAVAFVYVNDAKANRVANGTAFFVCVPSPKDAARTHVYLVTSKHVLRKDNGETWYERVFLRMNVRNGGSEFIEIPLRHANGDLVSRIHEDESVDLAVAPVLPPVEKFDFKCVDSNIITNQADYKDLNIREGSDVFFAGLFLPYAGSERIYPIVRFGKVALITPEKIPWNKIPMELSLLEISSFGGNSGSPVFFYLGSDRQPGALVVGPPVLKLAGVMMGTFLDHQPIQVVETNRVPISSSSAGIAAVVPANKLQEILFSDHFEKARNK